MQVLLHNAISGESVRLRRHQKGHVLTVEMTCGKAEDDGASGTVQIYRWLVAEHPVDTLGVRKLGNGDEAAEPAPLSSTIKVAIPIQWPQVTRARHGKPDGGEGGVGGSPPPPQMVYAFLPLCGYATLTTPPTFLSYRGI